MICRRTAEPPPPWGTLPPMPPAPSPPPLPGDRVGPYLLGDLLGVGGMATVYRATDASGAPVALKVLHPGMASRDEARRFKREFLTLQSLSHPHIVQVVAAGEHGDYPWIALEYVDGPELGRWIEGWGSAPPSDRFPAVEAIFTGLCEALAYLHDKGLVHRDLKPSNVLLTRTLQPKLTDFGVVKATEGSFQTQLTMAGRLVGTVAFMAPEQITGDPVDGRADLYSLGAVLYLMLSGRRPVVADSIPAYLARHLHSTPPPPSEVDPAVPAALDRVCMRLLQKEPARRYAGAREALADLRGEVAAPARPLRGREAEVEALQQVCGAASGPVSLTRLEGPAGCGKSALLDAMQAPAGWEVVRAGPALWPPLPAAPALWLIDDADRLSPDATAALAAALKGRGARGPALAVVLAAREVPGPLLAALPLGATALRLPPLDRRAITDILRDLGLAGPAAAILGTRLHQEGQGSPGAAVAWVAALVAAGWLGPDPTGGLRALRSPEELRETPLPLPEAVARREEARLGRLATWERGLVEAMVVLDMAAPADVLGELCGLDPATVESCADALGAAHITRRGVEGTTGVFSLDPSVPRDIWYGLLPPEARLRLHRAAADALSRRARRRGPAPEAIAAHRLAGGQLAEAFPLLLDQARRRLRAGRVDEARRAFRQAESARVAAEARLAPPDAARLRRELLALDAELRERQGDLTGALDAWERAGASADDPALAARARAGVGLVRAARGEVEPALHTLEPVLAALPAGDPLWPRVAQAVATARLVRGESAAATRLFDQLAHLAAETGAPAVEADAAAGRALVTLAAGELVAGRAALEAAEARLRPLGPGLPLARTLLLQGELALCDGRFTEAEERGVEAARIARELPRLITTVRGLGLQASARLAQGDAPGALRLAREGATALHGRARAETPPEVLAFVAVGRVLCAAGHPEEAAALLPPPPLQELAALEDPVGQLLALRAWAHGPRDPALALESAWGALGRSPALLPTAAARIALDAAAALAALGDAAAEDAVLEALDRTAQPGLRRLRLLALRVGLTIHPAHPTWLAAHAALAARLGADPAARGYTG